MDCTICFESINERTGSATLSCGHLFHFGCLARWILKNQTCPYCRHTANAFETIQHDEETNDESESEYESTEISNEEDHALWVFRSFFQDLEQERVTIPASDKIDQHIPYIDLLMRHEKTFDAGHDRGYDSA